MRGAVIADSEAKSVCASHLAPNPNDVALRADVHSIPDLMFRIPAIEVVVMCRQGDEILRSGSLVQLDQRVGVPSICLPEMADVLVAELRRVTILLDVIV